MNQAVFLFTFANDQDDYLPLLKKESLLLGQALEVLEDSGQVRACREESASIDVILNALERFDGQIAIFHYGGHAGGQQLHLEGGEAQAEGLARLLARQSEMALQLVFLNGCSTEGQVRRLLELGVKAVIATSVAIDDGKAVEFAHRFYRKLANKGNIRQAFETARDSLLLKYQGISSPEIHPVNLQRGAKFENDRQAGEIPWRLWYNEAFPDVLDWTIPSPFISFSRPEEEEPFEANDYIYPILEAMVDYRPELEQEIGRLEDEREYLDLIIRNFPWNIGSQIKILVSTDASMNQLRLSRLEQVISTYVAATQFLYYPLLSQLTGKNPEGDSALVQENLRRLFEVGPADFLRFDYILEFQDVMAKMLAGNTEPFIHECKGIYDELRRGKELHDVCQYLQSLKEQLASKRTTGLETGIQSECADAEYALACLLKHLAFIINYQMVTVRDINIFNPWHRETLFRHQMGRLYSSADDQLRLFKEPRSYGQYLENCSIHLLKNLEEIGSFLNLSPFYIDRNAFGGQEATATDLHTYAYTVQMGSGAQDYFYFKSSNNIFSVLEKRLDQIHTAQELEDNIKRTRFKGRLRSQDEPEKRRPYALLQEQFEKMQA